MNKPKPDTRYPEPGTRKLKEKDYWLAFSTFPQVGPVRFQHLLKNFGSAEKAWRAPGKELAKIGFSDKLIEDFERHKNGFNIASYLLRMERLEITAIIYDDSSYPELLKKIDDSPYLLYVRFQCAAHSAKDAGEKLSNIFNGVLVAVVGTRKMTAYGKEAAERFTTGLVDNNCTIVSGLALGIDSVAHRATVDAGGYTVGVLGGGLDNIYPPSNRRLAEKMLESGRGALISEYPLGYPYLPQNFPTRNRIIAGLVHGVLVIEGTEKSGTLLTASAAAKYGREVFAVPGPVTSPTSRAPHFLLKNGAKLVERTEDILEELQVQTKRDTQNARLRGQAKRILPETEEEKKLFNILKSEPLDIDSLVRTSGLPAGAVLSALTIMELKGMIKNLGGIYAAIL